MTVYIKTCVVLGCMFSSIQPFYTRLFCTRSCVLKLTSRWEAGYNLESNKELKNRQRGGFLEIEETAASRVWFWRRNICLMPFPHICPHCRLSNNDGQTFAVRFSCSPIIYMSLDFWKKPHRLHSHLQTQDLFLCELAVQTTEQPNNQAAHFDQDLIKVIFARWSDFISFHHKLRCLWLQILTAHQPAPSYATLARGSKHH